VTGYNFATLATEALIGRSIAGEYRTVELDWVGVKSPQFSYGRIKGADPLSYVEMTATGEVACFGDSYPEALLKSMQAAGFRIPKKNILVSLGGDEHKIKLLPALKKLHDMRFKLTGTKNTAAFLEENGIPCQVVAKISDGVERNIITFIEEGKADLIINIPQKPLARGSGHGFEIRRKAVDMNVPLITNRQLAEAFINALDEHRNNGLEAKEWGEYTE
jgi:carbamoyl-phosphate synthase large subunit